MSENRVILFLVMLVLASITLGVMLSNITTQHYLMPDAEHDLARCEEQGLKQCHIEWVYRGWVIVGYDTVGRESER